MGIFGSYKPKVTAAELNRARNDMAAAGLTRDEREEVLAAMNSHMDSDLKTHKGLDEREIDATLNSMDAMHDRNQNVRSAKLEKVRSIFKKYL